MGKINSWPLKTDASSEKQKDKHKTPPFLSPVPGQLQCFTPNSFTCPSRTCLSSYPLFFFLPPLSARRFLPFLEYVFTEGPPMLTAAQLSGAVGPLWSWNWLCLTQGSPFLISSHRGHSAAPPDHSTTKTLPWLANTVPKGNTRGHNAEVARSEAAPVGVTITLSWVNVWLHDVPFG